jgi:uncharacterized protein
MLLADLQIDQQRLDECCRRYRVERLETFGSFATHEAGPESDVDVLVTFQPDAGSGMEFVALAQDLEGILGRRVDLLTRVSVEHSPNKYFRRFALRHTELFYERT